MRRLWFMTLVVCLGFGLVASSGRAAGPAATAGADAQHGPNDRAAEEHGPKAEAHGHEAEHPEEEHEEHHEEPSDLLLRDFFTEGWREKFEERERAGRAPRFNLFHTRQGFLERVATVNYGYEYRAESARFDVSEAAAGFEYALNRRFEIDAEPFYTWKNARSDGGNHDGLRWDVGTRFQLLDTADAALNVQLRVLTPLTRLDDPQTAVSAVVAGFNDLTKTGLERTGLYYHLEHDALIGPRAAEPEADGLPPTQRASSRITYAVAMAKTLVEPETPLIGDFTVFLEGFGTTDLNGTHQGETLFAVTPGVRMNLAGREEKAWWLQAGVDVPVAGPRGYDLGLRVSLIHDF